jgi:hypothetical protein
VLEVPNLRFTGHQLQAFGNALVRLLVQMAAVPESEALRIGPVSDEPDFLGPVARAEDFHLNKAGLLIHEVRAMTERVFDLGNFLISDHEFADRDKRAGGLGADRLSRHEHGADRSDGFAKRTT